MTSKEINRRSLTGYKSREEAVAAAERLGNVAFVRGGKFLTCTGTYVCTCINAGQTVEVLADYEGD
jgi:hypothetical protein